MRVPATILAAGLAFGMAAGSYAKLDVVTSLEDFASIAAAVGGDRVEAFAIAKGYQDPHFVDPKPSFVLRLSRADLLVAAGLELEIGYLPPLIDQSRNAKIQPGSPATSTPRSAARSSRGRPRSSPGPWATSTRMATPTTGSTPRTAASSPARSRPG